jgi:hypothetical protein
MHMRLAHLGYKTPFATTASTNDENLTRVGEKEKLKFLDWAAGACTVIFLNISPTRFYVYLGTQFSKKY